MQHYPPIENQQTHSPIPLWEEQLPILTKCRRERKREEEMQCPPPTLVQSKIEEEGGATPLCPHFARRVVPAFVKEGTSPICKTIASYPLQAEKQPPSCPQIESRERGKHSPCVWRQKKREREPSSLNAKVERSGKSAIARSLWCRRGEGEGGQGCPTW